ncbi:MAG: glutathione S-transferase [Oligoflexus sp.]|nr:glutathione S-transferase [Oligoflexus sp.]
MIVLHHLNNSRSQRIIWLLEELGLTYEVKRYERDAKTMLAPAELRKIHPLGKSPVITDGNLVLAESGAIIEYLIDTYGKGRLRPEVGTQARLDYNYFLHYAEGSAMPPLLMSLVFTKMPKAPMPFFMKPIVKGIADKVKKSFVNPQIKSHFEFLEKHLETHHWFAGDEFTAADVQMSFVIEAGLARSGGKSRPRLSGFLDRIHARSAYQKALVAGGPFDILS